jgi:DNA-binding transcriptional regulator/RsmH inhibitor MraZ
MFGSKIILGNAELNLDDKGRVFIPGFTNVEKGEDLSLIENMNGNLNLFSNKQINLLIYKLNHSNNEEDKILLNKIYAYYIATEKVDSQKRIILPLDWRKVLESKKIYVQGALEMDLPSLRISSTKLR